VFLTRSLSDTPPVVAFYVKHSRSLHQRVVALTVLTESIPWVAESARCSLAQVSPDFWRAQAHYDSWSDRTYLDCWPACRRRASR